MSGGETLKIFEKAGTFADLVVLISQGDREEQQDFYGYYEECVEICGIRSKKGGQKWLDW